MKFAMIARNDGRTAVAREKKTDRDGGYVLVPVMTFDSKQAATLWISGQQELRNRGRKAGFDDKGIVADHMNLHYNLG